MVPKTSSAHLEIVLLSITVRDSCVEIMVIPNSRAIINNKKTSEHISEILNESSWRQRCFQLTLNIIMRRSLPELKKNSKIDINYLVVCSNDSFNEILEHMNMLLITFFTFSFIFRLQSWQFECFTYFPAALQIYFYYFHLDAYQKVLFKFASLQYCTLQAW